MTLDRCIFHLQQPRVISLSSWYLTSWLPLFLQFAAPQSPGNSFARHFFFLRFLSLKRDTLYAGKFLTFAPHTPLLSFRIQGFVTCSSDSIILSGYNIADFLRLSKSNPVWIFIQILVENTDLKPHALTDLNRLCYNNIVVARIAGRFFISRDDY